MNMKSLKKVYTLAAVAFFLVVMVTPSFFAKAANPSTISISPVTFDLSGNPGDTVTNEIMIRNSGSDPAEVSVEAQDFVATGEEGEVTLEDRNDSYSLSKWIQVDSSKFELQGGQSKAVKFVIRIPYNAEPGGHYASVFAHLSPTNGNAQSGSLVGQKIASLVLLRVGGNAKEDAKIAGFTTSMDSYEAGPVDFNIRIQNTGSVHIKPKGIIAITDIFGKKIADVPVEQKNVLPDATRHMTAKWENVPTFGKFTASLLTYYGTDNKQITAATTFWIIPWKLILVWSLVIIAVIVVLWLGRKRLKNAFKALINKN